MDNAVNVVVLSKYQDIFNQFQTSIDRYEPNSRRTLVQSIEDSTIQTSLALHYPERWGVIYSLGHFIFARNANLGINNYPHSDVLLVNDDVQFTKKNSIQTLSRIAYESPEIGIISPVIKGQVGNMLQLYNPNNFENQTLVSNERLAFVCVYIKREVINKIGLLDEVFDGYGGDDVDYSIRAQKAGYALAVAPQVVVTHGFDKLAASSSFNRVLGEKEQLNSMLKMNRIVREKHCVERVRL